MILTFLMHNTYNFYVTHTNFLQDIHCFFFFLSQIATFLLCLLAQMNTNENKFTLPYKCGTSTSPQILYQA
jgi:hypothetical protein